MNSPPARGHSVVAVVLAVGLVTAVNLITVAVLYDAIFSEGPGLSENATQIITTVFGGIIGVLGSYIGYRAGASNGAPPTYSTPPPEPPASLPEVGSSDT